MIILVIQLIKNNRKMNGNIRNARYKILCLDLTIPSFSHPVHGIERSWLWKTMLKSWARCVPPDCSHKDPVLQNKWGWEPWKEFATSMCVFNMRGPVLNVWDVLAVFWPEDVGMPNGNAASRFQWESYCFPHQLRYNPCCKSNPSNVCTKVWWIIWRSSKVCQCLNWETN